jgi:hypothetical protein
MDADRDRFDCVQFTALADIDDEFAVLDRHGGQIRRCGAVDEPGQRSKHNPAAITAGTRHRPSR